MANFCNKCGAPVSGIFCVKCGADTRLAGSPAPQAAPPQSPPAQAAPPQAPPLQAAPPPPAPAAPAPMPPPAVAAVPASPYAKFCNKCGTPSIGTAFCNKCGADMRQATAPALPATPVSQAAPAAQAQTKGSPLTKILIGFAVVVIAVGAMAAGGVYYVVYRVKQKVHEVARDAGLSPTPDSSSGSGGGSLMGSISKMVSGGSGGSSDSDTNGGISGDPCRLLSTQEVGRAIGVEIVATQPAEGGCSYLAHGDSGDMTAKHMAAMMAKNGADAKTQQMIQGFAGGMAKAFQSEGHEKTSDSNGNVPVFTFGVDNHAAEAQMRLNAKVLGRLGPGQVDIPGIGDQAFDEAGAMLMVRKGDKMIRIMYSTCPCSLDAIKPLAKMLADRL